MGRIVIIGDEHQCQPTGTMVEVVVNSGNRWHLPVIEKKPIESITVGDKVVSLRRYERQWNRCRNVLETSSRPYDGDLVVVKTQTGLISRYTPNHRCLVNFSPLRGKWAVYIMRKGNQYRVGKSKVDYGSAGSGLIARMDAENADFSWILSLHDNDIEARIWEVIVSANFGLPQTVFKRGNVNIFTDEDIAKIWSEIGDNSQKGEECLRYFGRCPEYPLFADCERDFKKSLKRPMFVHACNIMSGCLVLPYTMGSERLNTAEGFAGIIRKEHYIPIQVSRETYSGQVHSLSIEEDETYVADGILTHNSIFGFRGADIDAFRSFHQMLSERSNGCVQFPLSVCRRCPRSHIRLAQALVPDIQWMTKENSGVDAPEGEIYQVSLNAALDAMQEGDLGQARVTKNLIPAAYQLIRMRKKVVVRGRDIGAGILSLIKKMKATSIEDLLVKVGKWFDKEVAKLCKKEGVDDPKLLEKNASKFQSLEDRVGCIEALCEGIETLDELISTVKGLFADFDDDGKPKSAIVLGTVHRTKGLEAHNVTILDPSNFPHYLAKKTHEVQQERNLAYVACTRAAFKLDKSGNVIEPGRLTFVGQCPKIFKADWLAGLKVYPKPEKV